MNSAIYMVYGKRKDEKRFRPFDMNGNRFVNRLFYATMFFEKDLEALQQEVNYMNQHNPEYVFKIVKKK